MGGMHAACYKAIEGVSLTAVSDAVSENAEKIAREHNAKVFENALDLINSDEVDAVDICLPTYLHTRYAVEAMKRGKAVFIEKPVSRDLEEAELLLKTRAETGANVMVGQVIRFWDEYVWIKEAIDSKKYGDVVSVVLKRVSSLPSWAWNGWLHNDKLSGGAALDMHIHDVDYIRYILGEPGEVSSIARRDENGSMTQIFTSYKFPGGVIATSEACWDYPPDFPFCMEIRVKLEKATIVYNSAESVFAVYPNEGGSFKPELNTVTLDNRAGGNISSLGGYYNELKYFVERVSNNKPIENATLKDSVESLKLALREISAAD
jgi:predicted dehydrogenase